MKNFKEILLEYLIDKNITVTTTEQEGENKSIVCHIAKDDNVKITNVQKEMEQKFDVCVMLSDAYGMNVVIIEANDMEE